MYYSVLLVDQDGATQAIIIIALADDGTATLHRHVQGAMSKLPNLGIRKGFIVDPQHGVEKEPFYDVSRGMYDFGDLVAAFQSRFRSKA